MVAMLESLHANPLPRYVSQLASLRPTHLLGLQHCLPGWLGDNSPFELDHGTPSRSPYTLQVFASAILPVGPLSNPRLTNNDESPGFEPSDITSATPRVNNLEGGGKCEQKLHFPTGVGHKTEHRSPRGIIPNPVRTPNTCEGLGGGGSPGAAGRTKPARVWFHAT
jgi:hypothetical protein